MPRVYLAGPMRGHPVETAMEWRRQLAETLHELDFETLTPGIAEGALNMDADHIMCIEDAQGTHDVVRFDHHMVTTSDYILANLSYAFKMPTGTLAEISWAYALGIPVIVVGDNAYVREPFIQEQAIAVVPTLDDVVHTLMALEGRI